MAAQERKPILKQACLVRRAKGTKQSASRRSPGGHSLAAALHPPLFFGLPKRQAIYVQSLDCIRQVGLKHEGARASFTI